MPGNYGLGMGAWGNGIYDNDDAADWSGDLASGGASTISVALDAALNTEYLESPDGASALAAADVVARLRSGGGVSSAYSEGVEAWVKENQSTPADDLVERALRALAVVRGPNSELMELWSEDPDALAAWSAEIDDVERRLKA